MQTRMQQTNREEYAQLELVFYALKNKSSETLLGHIEQEQHFKDFMALKVYECQKLINSHTNYYEGEAQCDVQVFVINNMFKFQCPYHF